MLEELMHKSQPEASRPREPRGRNVAPRTQHRWFGCHVALRRRFSTIMSMEQCLPRVLRALV